MVTRSAFERGRPSPKRPRPVDLTPLEDLVDVFRARRVLVVGSAPLEGDIYLEADERLVTVNGSLSSVPGADPDLHVMNARIGPHPGWNKTRRFLNRTMEQQSAGRHVSSLLFLPVQDEAEGPTAGRLAGLGMTWDRLLSVNSTTQERLCYRAGAFRPEIDRHKRVSAGLFAAILALVSGAAVVRLEGFSWEPGYHYLAPALVPPNSRGHKTSDVLALENLRRIGAPLEGRFLQQRRGAA